VVFILPPSLETLGLRLRQRATEDTATIERRTADARAEIVLVDSVADYVIVNDDAARAGKTLSALVEAELLKRTSPAWGDMAARLLRNGAIA
jgi:guanylate kinase